MAALAFLALFAMAAGRGFNARRSNTVDGSQNALPQAGLDDRGVAANDGSDAVRAPDISSLSPQERVRAIFDLIASGMRLLETSPKRETGRRLQEAQEAEWQRIQKELFARHVR